MCFSGCFARSCFLPTLRLVQPHGDFRTQSRSSVPGLVAGTPRPPSMEVFASLRMPSHQLSPGMSVEGWGCPQEAKPVCAGPLRASLGASHGSACPGAGPGPVAHAPAPAGRKSEKATLLPAQGRVGFAGNTGWVLPQSTKLEGAIGSCLRR